MGGLRDEGDTSPTSTAWGEGRGVEPGDTATLPASVFRLVLLTEGAEHFRDFAIPGLLMEGRWNWLS